MQHTTVWSDCLGRWRWSQLFPFWYTPTLNRTLKWKQKATVICYVRANNSIFFLEGNLFDWSVCDPPQPDKVITMWLCTMCILEYIIPWYQCCLFRREYQSILYHEITMWYSVKSHDNYLVLLPWKVVRSIFCLVSMVIVQSIHMYHMINTGFYTTSHGKFLDSYLYEINNNTLSNYNYMAIIMFYYYWVQNQWRRYWYP